MDKRVYRPAFEALFVNALGSRLGPRCRARLAAEAGLELAAPLAESYPFDAWLRAIAVVVEEVLPHRSVPEAWRFLGAELIHGYRGTLLGKATLLLAEVVGPRVALARLAESFRLGCNYLEADLLERGERDFELAVNEVGPHPEFTQGTLEAGLEASGARGPRVTVLSHNGHAALYRIRWS